MTLRTVPSLEARVGTFRGDGLLHPGAEPDGQEGIGDALVAPCHYDQA